MHHQPRKRVFLFLQGPPGPFFARLGEALAARGHAVRRINFNGGDRRAWSGPAVDYLGSTDEWPLFFDAFVREHGVTDLVLFGDCRPLHTAARGLAAPRGVRIHVFEEGYIRPDWVTLEAGGVNGNSSLSRDPDWYLAMARTLPPVPHHPPIASSFQRRARQAFDYYAHSVLQSWRFRGYRSHRRQSAVVEALGWAKRLATARRARVRSERVQATLAGASYFVFPLQLDSDVQVRIHSPFGNVRAALDYVVESFARAAPPGDLLAVKLHPLDNGLTNWRSVAINAAKRFGVGERLRFLEEGDIAEIVAGARGVVTINSTTGTLSVGAGVPTIVLGHAVYDIAGVTHQGSLDSFWSNPAAPDPAAWDAFCRVLLQHCLVRGGFVSEEGLDLLVAGSVERLLAPLPYDHLGAAAAHASSHA